MAVTFGPKKKTTGKVAVRARKRYKRLRRPGGRDLPSGVSPKGGFSGREARRLRGALKGAGGSGQQDGSDKPSAKERRAQRKALYDPSQVLAGDSLKRAVSQLVNAELKPQLGALDREVAEQRAVGGEIGRRLSGYAGQEAMTGAVAQQQTRSAADQLAAKLAGVNQTAYQQAGAAGQGALQASQADAAIRGQGLAGGAAEQAVREQTAAQARAGAQGQTLSGTALGSAYGQVGTMAALTAAGAQRATEGQREVALRTQRDVGELLAKRSDLAAQKGPLHTKLLLQLREAGFEQLATQIELGIDKQQIAATLRGQDVAAETAEENRQTSERNADVAAQTSRQNAALSARTQRRSQNITMRGQDISSADRAAARRAAAQAKKGGVKSMTPTQRRTLRTNISKAVGFMEGARYETGKGRNKKQQSWLALYKRNPKKYGPAMRIQLKEQYGNPIADLAMKRLRQKYDRKINQAGWGTNIADLFD
jgi:hypothetical protein